jgi:thioredoxin 1
MKSKIFLLLPVIGVLVFLIISTYAQKKNQGIVFFNGTLKEAIGKAKKESKLVFFDAYASWCGPCRYMDSLVYTNKSVADFFNKHFVSIRVDMEKGEGPDLAKKYTSVDGYPSLVFLDGGGHVIKTILGSRSEKGLLGEAKYALEN